MSRTLRPCLATKSGPTSGTPLGERSMLASQFMRNLRSFGEMVSLRGARWSRSCTGASFESCEAGERSRSSGPRRWLALRDATREARILGPPRRAAVIGARSAPITMWQDCLGGAREEDGARGARRARLDLRSQLRRAVQQPGRARDLLDDEARVVQLRGPADQAREPHPLQHLDALELGRRRRPLVAFAGRADDQLEQRGVEPLQALGQ